MSARLLTLAARVVRLLPFRVARALGRVAGRLAWRRGVGATMVPRHLDRLGLDPSLGTRVVEAYGQYWAETLWLAPGRNRGIRSRLEVVGKEYFDAAHANGAGAIYALPHVGNWEYAAILPWSEDILVVAVAEDLPDSAVTDWFIRTRALTGIEVVLADGSRAMMERLLRGLKDGAGIALLADRDVTGTGLEVEFFGEETRLPTGPVSIGLSTGAAILPVACFATPGGHRLVIRPPLAIPDAATKSERVRLGTQALARELEALILEDPVQWHLLQPNWPSDPGYRS